MHMTCIPFVLQKQNKDLQTLHAQANKMVYSFLSLSNGSIKICVFFFVVCVVLRKNFQNKAHVCVNKLGFC